MCIEDFLSELEREHRGTVIVSLWTVTHPKLLKKSRKDGAPCPYCDIEHRAKVRAILGAVYENSVNNQRAREVDDITDLEHFTAEGLWGGAGQRDSRYTVKHVKTGERYVAIKLLTTNEHNIPLMPESTYVDPVSGKEVPRSELDDFLPKQNEDSGRQDVDKKVFWQTVKIKNIHAVQMDGKLRQFHTITLRTEDKQA